MLKVMNLSALLIYGATVIGATVMARPDRVVRAAESSADAALQTLRLRNHGPLVGCVVNLHHTQRIDQYLHAVNEMIDHVGFGSVTVVTPAYQTDGKSDQIRVIHEPGMCPHRDDLVALLRHARSRGATTLLMPVVLLADPEKNEWRGKIQPANWSRWWLSYRGIIDYFLDIANQADVDVFCVGSELLSTERQTYRWQALISRVRRRFEGLLTYSTNWDHYQVPTFWRHLDLIGVNGYFDLTTLSKDRANPQFQELIRRWQQIRQQLLAHADNFDRPILFTELGYPSLPWALQDPWNYVNEENLTSDPSAQARGYSAFLSAWDDLLTWAPKGHGTPFRFAGVFFYRWDPYQIGDASDTGYGIRGKTTIDLLTAFLKRKRRIADDATAN